MAKFLSRAAHSWPVSTAGLRSFSVCASIQAEPRMQAPGTRDVKALQYVPRENASSRITRQDRLGGYAYERGHSWELADVRLPDSKARASGSGPLPSAAGL